MDRTSSKAIEEEYAFEERKMASQLASGRDASKIHPKTFDCE